MNITIYTRKRSLEADPRLAELSAALERGGHRLSVWDSRTGLPQDTQMLLAVGGDGTFLSSSTIVRDSGIPVLGVNLGRLGFLSENVPEAVAEALARGEYSVEKRTMLRVSGLEASANGPASFPYALNEMTVHRSGAAMLGVDVSINSVPLPTYWADGLLVATSSGSTAYSLSVGGPIALPESRVLIVSPISPHNLNVRPLVVPDSSEISISFRSRDRKVVFTMDNRTLDVPADSRLEVKMAQFSLNRVRLNNSNFIKALTSKLYWGEDIRNGNE